ncbi:DUF2797 domain-containing protein [Alkanindiges sp. WGS2144]|uniref:DUF2797 domain-containing protein n=1 Tax=Alkanindiges sp. WGS2144 TaxID=3366808 RepID=UPI003752ACCE
MEYQGICQKMRAKLGESTTTSSGALSAAVEYSLVLGSFVSPFTQLVGSAVELQWTGKIYCVACGAKTNKSFSQGHCYRCFSTKAACDMCMMKPETCHHHLGTCREPEWAERVCFNPHIVYLANSSGLKVGITRHTQMPTRWLDQGATQAIPIFQTQSRFLSGVVETLLAQHMSDKTDWRKLLKGVAEPLDLQQVRDDIFNRYEADLSQLQHAYPEQVELLQHEAVHEFVYPVNKYPAKVSAHNFDKTPIIKGHLNGIKGQYLLLDTGVLNIRKFSGYELIVRA